jgi:iron complex transport system substrate-binding protein
MKTLTCACLFARREQQILLVRVRNNKHWYLPGGKIEPVETARQALLRELAEEVSIEIEPSAIRQEFAVIGPAYEEQGDVAPAIKILCDRWMRSSPLGEHMIRDKGCSSGWHIRLSPFGSFGRIKLISIPALLSLIGCRSFCASPSYAASPRAQEVVTISVRTGFPVNVQDDLGRTFRFDAPPKRIVSLTPGYTETLFALGLGDRVVGVDDYSDFPPEAASKAKVGSGQYAGLERIVSLQPDLVVALVEQDLMDSLVARGIPALRLFPNDLDGVMHSILLLGEIAGRESRAQEIVDGMRRKIERVQSRVQGRRPPRVFLELDGTDPARPFTSGLASFIGDMIRIAGGSNIAKGIRTSSSQMSLEAVVAADPEIIVLSDAKNPVNPQTKEAVLRRRGWSGITAVRKGAVIQVDNVFFFRPSLRIVDGVEMLARIFHPEAFQ